MSVFYTKNTSTVLPISDTNPTVNDDLSAGYLVGAEWFNVRTAGLYICSDNTIGAAVWIRTTPSAFFTSASLDGQTQFVIPDQITSPSATLMFINGIEYNYGNDYFVSGSTVIWGNEFPLEKTDAILFKYR